MGKLCAKIVTFCQLSYPCLLFFFVCLFVFLINSLIRLPGESHGQRSLAGHSPWGWKEKDTTKAAEHTGTRAICSGLFSSSPRHFLQLVTQPTKLTCKLHPHRGRHIGRMVSPYPYIRSKHGKDYSNYYCYFFFLP